MQARIYKRVRLEDATRAVLGGRTYVGKRDQPSYSKRATPGLPQLRCQAHGPEDYDDPTYRRWTKGERFG